MNPEISKIYRYVFKFTYELGIIGWLPYQIGSYGSNINSDEFLYEKFYIAIKYPPAGAGSKYFWPEPACTAVRKKARRKDNGQSS